MLSVIVFGVFAFPKTAPANVQEQRARLPPPATCQDPVEGVWMSHKYDPTFRDWYIFTLTVRRAPDGTKALVGEIHSHFWRGGPQHSEPPSCSLSGHVHITVKMSAAGLDAWPEIRFWGTKWQLEHDFCGAGGIGYNLDHFSGRIDPALQEFQSVNNDGGRSVNDPQVFRRVRCIDDAARDPISNQQGPVKPPPLVPHARGCAALGCAR